MNQIKRISSPAHTARTPRSISGKRWLVERAAPYGDLRARAPVSGRSIAVFRSLARGEATADSDVDFLVSPCRARGTRSATLLEALHLAHLQPAWATSATTRAKRAPKVHLVDSGLVASLLGLGERELTSLDRNRELGFLLESFVVTELP